MIVVIGKMVRKIIFSIFALILLIGIVSAVDTNIKVKTLPSHKVSIFIYPDEGVTLINSFHIMSDSSGIVQTTHTSGHEEIDILVKVTKNGDNVIDPFKFEGYTAGNPVYIRYDYDEKDGEYSDVVEVNETEDNIAKSPAGEGNVTENSSETEAAVNPPVTGEAISGESEGFFSWLIYIGIGALLVVGLVVLFVLKSSGHQSMKGVPSPPKNPVFAHGGVSMPSVGQEFSSDEITKLENKLEEAQREIKMLKNKEKIKQAEDKLRQDSLELERLRKGEI